MQYRGETMPHEIQNALHNIADLLLDAVVIVDLHGKVIYASVASESVFGFSPAELLGRQLFYFLYPEDRTKTLAESLRVMSGTSRVGFENRYIRKDGSIAHIMWSARWDPKLQLRIGVARDITAKKRTEAMQAASYEIAAIGQSTDDLQALYHKIYCITAALLPVADFILIERGPDASLQVVYQTNMTGTKALLTNSSLDKAYTEAHRAQYPIITHLANELSSNAKTSFLIAPLSPQTGSESAFLLKSHPNLSYLDSDRDLLQFICTQAAIAIERRRLIDDLHRSARYDELTDLPNRRLFFERFESTIAQCCRQGTKAALLYLDVDGFKQINDSLGHVAGDALLRHIASRMKGLIRSEDMVARIGGDEFVILLPHVHTREEADAVAAKIGAVCKNPMDLEQVSVTVSISIGISIYPDHGSDVTQLIKYADQAMYTQKCHRP